MTDPDLTTFHRKLAERRAAKEAELRKAQQEQQANQFDNDLIPSVDLGRSEEDQAMDNVIGNIDILDAYRKWCGKMNPDPKGKTEGIKISCPIPGHADKNPSAWINTDNQTWFCGGCQQGGDAHDIAAFHFGFPVPGYKEGSQFHELRRKMAEDFGFVFTYMPGGVTVVTGPEPTSDGDAEDGEAETKEAEVIELYQDQTNYVLPGLDWRPIVPKNTFLDAYMKCTTLDDVPEEYHFWNALLALGFALGRDVTLYDRVPVYPNLFVCTLGHSGSGKSQARYHLDKLLSRALPHDWSSPVSIGVRKISAPGSAEVLIHNFQKPVQDPNDPKKVAYYAPVRGIIDFSELSSLMGRANRMGNTSIPTLMQFYDMEDIIATSSMTHGAKEAHLPFASALTTTQPKALRGLLSATDAASGFLNRWVFASGTPKRRMAIGGVMIDIEPAVKPLLDIQGWAGSFKPNEQVQWSDEASQVFTDFYHNRIEIDKQRSDTDMITRVDLLMKKLILLFTANLKLKIVPVECVEWAIRCYGYLVAAYGILDAEIGTTLSSEISDSVLEYARKEYDRNKRGVTLNMLAKSFKRRKYPHEMLLRTCDSLVKLGMLEIEPPPKNAVGRPTTRYRYVG
jgi:hypothetical protein